MRGLDPPWFPPPQNFAHLSPLSPLSPHEYHTPETTSHYAHLFPQAHVERVKAHNGERTHHGRYLLGHEFVDACLGGVFLVDDSLAMPSGAAPFMLEQVRAYGQIGVQERGVSARRSALAGGTPVMQLAEQIYRKHKLFEPPPSAECSLSLSQLACTLDYWFSRLPARPPRYNIFLVSGDGSGVFMFPDGLEPVTGV